MRWDWTDLEMSLDHTPRSCPNEGKRRKIPWWGCLKDAHQEAFRKDSNLVKWIRQTYFRAHHPEFNSEITHTLGPCFQGDSRHSLLKTKIHQVQDPWPGKKELCAANCAAMSSAKDIFYFWVVSPTESSNIMGLKGIHSPEALKCQGGLSFCPWCGKEE